MRKFVLLSLLLFGIGILSFAQKNPDNSSENLIVNHYDNGFTPFLKGNWYTGLSFKYQDKMQENTNNFFESVVDGENRNWGIQGSFGRYMSDYFMMGLSVNYNQSKFTGELENNDNERFFRNQISQNYKITPFLRTSIPLTKNQRLSVYNDLRLDIGYNNSLKRETKNIDEISKTMTDEFDLNIGLAPGITFFILENFALEAGLTIIGYNFKYNTQQIDEMEEAKTVEHDFRFSLNIFSANIKATYYITR